MIEECRDIFLLGHGNLSNGSFSANNNKIIFKSAASGNATTIDFSDIKQIREMFVSNGLGLSVGTKDGSVYMFGGFSSRDIENIKSLLAEPLGSKIVKVKKCLKGSIEGSVLLENGILEFKDDDESIYEFPLSCVSNVSTGKNEIGIQFEQLDGFNVSLVEMRYHVDPTKNLSRNSEILTKELADDILKGADILGSSDSLIIELNEIPCLTPRGKYSLQIHQTFIRMHGKSYDFKIPFRSIVQLFLLKQQDPNHKFFVMNVEPALRQGQTRYNFVVFHFDVNEKKSIPLSCSSEIRTNLKEITEKYSESATNCLKGKVYKIFSDIIRKLSSRIMFTSEDYKSSKGDCFINSSIKASLGWLYPLERGLLFLYKPTMYIRHEEIRLASFARGATSSKTFDLELLQKMGQSVTITSIEKEELENLVKYFADHNIEFKNNINVSNISQAILNDVDEKDGNDESESSEDEDFNPNTTHSPEDSEESESEEPEESEE